MPTSFMSERRALDTLLHKLHGAPFNPVSGRRRRGECTLGGLQVGAVPDPVLRFVDKITQLGSLALNRIVGDSLVSHRERMEFIKAKLATEVRSHWQKLSSAERRVAER